MAVDAVRLVSLFLHQADPAREPAWRPPTDIYRLPDGWLVKLELPGVRPDDFKLTLQGRTLVVRGRRRDCCLDDNAQVTHMEINYGPFERRIELPADLNRVRIDTQFRDGMLLVRVRPEESE